MSEFVVPRRRRGRPRAGESNTRERILQAATAEFGDHGYDAATMRAIAARADVDPSLLHHYFGTKADLFGEVVGAPMRPDRAVAQIVAGARSEIGARIVRYILETWDDPAVRSKGTVLVRAAIGNKLTTPLLAGFLSREVLGRIAKELDVADADLRAGLAASQIAGLLITRYILQLKPLADASIDELVDRIGPTLQRYFFD